MKISRITLRHLRMPLRTPFETSFGRSEERDCILLEVFAEGLVGYGECVADRDPGYSYETAGTAWHILRDFLVPTTLAARSAPAGFQDAASVRHAMAKPGLNGVVDLQGKMGAVAVTALAAFARRS
jgi:O-succinylbenzoate synthase